MCLVEHNGIYCAYDMVRVNMEYWHTDISVHNLCSPFGYVCFSVVEHVIGTLS